MWKKWRLIKSALEILVKGGKVVNAGVRFFSYRFKLKFKGFFALSKLIDEFIKVDCLFWMKDFFLFQKPKKDHNKLIFTNNELFLFQRDRRYLEWLENLKFIDFNFQTELKDNEKGQNSILFLILNYNYLVFIFLIELLLIISLFFLWESKLGCNIMINLHMIIEGIQFNHVISCTQIASSNWLYHHLRISIIFRFLKGLKYFKISFLWYSICIIQKLVSTIFITFTWYESLLFMISIVM